MIEWPSGHWAVRFTSQGVVRFPQRAPDWEYEIGGSERIGKLGCGMLRSSPNNPFVTHTSEMFVNMYEG